MRKPAEARRRWVAAIAALAAAFIALKWFDDDPKQRRTSDTVVSCGATPPDATRDVSDDRAEPLPARPGVIDQATGDDETGAGPIPASAPKDPESARLERLARAYSTEPPQADPARAAGLLVRVQDERDQPISRAIVGLVASERRRRVRLPETAPGTYEQSVLPPGTWTLRVFALGAATVVQELALGPGERREIDVRLERALGVSGSVVDGSGAPVPRFSLGLFALEARGMKRLEQVDSALSGEDGSFVFFGVGDGRYRIEPANGRPLRTPIEVRPPATGLVVKLDRLLLRGRVTGLGGAPVANARLVLSPRGEPVRVDDDDESGIAGASSNDGIYGLLYDAPGAFDLHVRARGHRGKVERMNLGAGGASHDVPLEPQQPVRGLVVDGSGAPVAGADVWAEDGVKARIGISISRDDGSFELDADAEDVTVRARRGDAWSSPASADDRAVAVRLELTRRAPLVRGRVLDPRGGPVSRFKLGYDEFNAPDGRFEWSAPSAGSTDLRFEGAFVPVDVPVTLREGETTDVGDVRVVPLAKLAGRLLAFGTVSPSSCELEAVTGGDAYPGNVSWEGRFTIEVPAGESVEIRARCAEGWARRSSSCGSGTCESDLTLEPGGSLRLSLARPPGPAIVRVEGPMGTVADHLEVGALPKVLGGLAPGRYVVERLGRAGGAPAEISVVVGATVDVTVPEAR